MKEDDEKERLAALRTINEVVTILRTAVSPVATLASVQTYLTLAINEGKSLTEISKVMHQTVATTSRNMLDLGDRNRRKEPGYGLVKSEQNPMELRSNMYSLSPKGRMLADQIAAKIKKGAE